MHECIMRLQKHTKRRGYFWHSIKCHVLGTLLNCWDLQASNSNKNFESFEGTKRLLFKPSCAQKKYQNLHPTESWWKRCKKELSLSKICIARTFPQGRCLFRGSTSYSNSLEEPMLKAATPLRKSDLDVFGRRKNASTVLDPSSNLDKIRTHYRSETNCFRFYKKYPCVRHSPMNHCAPRLICDLIVGAVHNHIAHTESWRLQLKPSHMLSQILKNSWCFKFRAFFLDSSSSKPRFIHFTYPNYRWFQWFEIPKIAGLPSRLPNCPQRSKRV